MELVKACADRIVPPALQFDASERAASEREGNRPSSTQLADGIARLEQFVGSQGARRESLVLFTGKRWSTGRTVKWHFIDGDAASKDLVFSLASRWLDVANLRFERTRDRAAADVRVTFQRGGSWSYLGTDCLSIPDDEPTMQLGWLLDYANPLGNPDSFEEWRRVTVHEAGHMLGFGHEHSHPERGFEWNEPAVYDYYSRTQGWSRSETYSQVIRKYDATVTNFSAYDRDSIMEYPIPAQLVLDPADAVGWNTSRSITDRRYAALWYPREQLAAFLNAHVEQLTRAAEIELHARGERV